MRHALSFASTLPEAFSKTSRYHEQICKRAFIGRRSMSTRHRAFIALGSNIGDGFASIEKACCEMEAKGLKILKTSSLFKTKAMYVEDQDDFLNGVCEIETGLEPLSLLDQLQSIEKKLGRVKLIDKGPRNIDLDILLYDEKILDHERLQIPHKLMLEREFVLRPLLQILPSNTLPSPLQSETNSGLLASISKPDFPISAQVPLTPCMPPLTPANSTRRTRLMSILNLTPDSFSDGGLHLAPSADLRATISAHIAAGATILDVGGQSTAPNAPEVTADEELARIMPPINIINSLPPEIRATVALSVDTYRADVAREAVRAGADIINDVSAGQMDPDMLATMAELGTTVVLMHMRGTPATMNCLADYPDGVLETVGRELCERVKEAEAAGVRRWRIILDPGIGFAKNKAQNLEILRNLRKLREVKGLQGLPWLVGTSRKRFIGSITGVKDASKRGWGTAAAVAAAVQGGSEIVRVHDVEEMGAVVKVADAVWRA